MIGRNSPHSQRGAILLVLLVTVVVLGLSAGMAGQAWLDAMQRERELELLWRGQQYQQAIESYYNRKKMLPARLEELQRDPRFPGIVRHIRKLYKDPMTNEDWELVKDPAQKITGVRSRSDLEPFKKDGFPESLEKLKNKNSYKEWEFVFAPKKAKAKTPPNRIPGSAPSASDSPTENPMSGSTSNRVILPSVPQGSQE